MRDRLTADQQNELAVARGRIAELERLAARPPTMDELKAMTADEIADELERPGGRQRVSAALSGETPVDALRFGDETYVASLTPAQVADNWPAIEQALSAPKEIPAP